MPDEKWLQNEPQSWHDINRALQDISLLLTYLVPYQPTRDTFCTKNPIRSEPE